MAAMMPYIYLGFGGFFFLYFSILWIYCGRIPAFGWFWSLGGSIFTLLGVFTMSPLAQEMSRIGMTIGLLIFLAAYLAGIFWLVSAGKHQSFEQADYLIVLGAHVNGTRPSKALMSRIRTAYEYLKRNPLTKTVLTGGQGSGEEIAEAACMEQEFIKLGIAKGRLLIEDCSKTTKENIFYSKKIILDDWKKNKGDPIEPDKLSIIVVTNEFHALRGEQIGKMAGFGKVGCLRAPSSPIMKLHYYTRELFSWIKLCVLSLRKKRKTGE